MAEFSKVEIKRRAAEYIGKRERASGVPFPFQGQEFDLCVALMAAFACEIVAEELSELVGPKVVHRQ